MDTKLTFHRPAIVFCAPRLLPSRSDFLRRPDITPGCIDTGTPESRVRQALHSDKCDDMATLLGDYGASHSAGFHTMITTPGLSYSQQHPDSSHYRSNSHSRNSAPRRRSVTRQRSPARYAVQDEKDWDTSTADSTDRSGASRFPSPPDSSSGSAGSASQPDKPQHGQRQQGQVPIDDSTQHSAQGITATPYACSSATSTTAASSSSRTQGNQVPPSPASDSADRWSASTPVKSSLASPADTPRQTTIHIRDLAHIQALVKSGEMNQIGLDDPPLQRKKYEISGMPIGDIIEMVAALLTKITTTNDDQHDALSRNAVERNASHVKQAQAQNDGSATEHSMSPMSSSVLAFHGKNVPAITILSYLSRIHKYCPTTYEVFLSLLVYFDRMTERVNDLVMRDEEAKKSGQVAESAQPDVVMKDDGESSESDLDEDIADDDEDDSESDEEQGAPTRSSPTVAKSGTNQKFGEQALVTATQPTFFVVDSFNIHRLIIAGVTCASKFFSDVFYTNSRYAKVCDRVAFIRLIVGTLGPTADVVVQQVGGLPLAELNHLEIQFLVLNDFRLAVPVEDLEAYATMLVEFYAREVVAQEPTSAASTTASSGFD